VAACFRRQLIDVGQLAERDWDTDKAIQAIPTAVATGRSVRSMTSPLKMTVYRPAGRLGQDVRAFQVFSATEPGGVSVLDFGGCDVSVPVCFGHPVLVEDWDRAEVPSAAGATAGRPGEPEHQPA
jgi:hypothetical protein